MRVEIREEESVIVVRFMSGLSLDIRDKGELLPYHDFQDLIQICIKVEQKNLRKGSRRSSYFNSFPKKEFKREGKFIKEKSKEIPSNNLPQENYKRKKINMLHSHALVILSVLNVWVARMSMPNVLL